MDVSIDADDYVTVFIHDFTGRPVIVHEPDVSVKRTTIKIGNVEIALMRGIGENGEEQGAYSL